MSKKIVMFSSNSCGPCAVLKPLIQAEQNTRGFEFELHILETTVDTKVFSNNGVRAVPVVIAFDGIKEIGRITGATTSKALSENLDKWGV